MNLNYSQPFDPVTLLARADAFTLVWHDGKRDVEFVFAAFGSDVSYRIPADALGMLRVMRRDAMTAHHPETPLERATIASLVMSDWSRVQAALIWRDLTLLAKIMLPYALAKFNILSPQRDAWKERL